MTFIDTQVGVSFLTVGWERRGFDRVSISTLCAPYPRSWLIRWLAVVIMKLKRHGFKHMFFSSLL